MQYIPIISEKDLVLDQNKRIMPNGKIEMLDPVSTNPIDVYTYDSQNNRYVVATNPIYLDVESRPQHTYFVKQLAYCRLSKYLGEFTDPLTHSSVANYEFVRDWYGAFNSDDAKNDTIISGITSLSEANTELGKVTVVGYWTDKDCEARTYVWDPNCTQDPDGGYIVKNKDLDTGRWILMFDGEYLPSTYYGVYPGRESTMNALLNYVATVGTAQKPTAPGIYFAPGNYTASSTALVTAKKVLLDAATYFSRTSFDVGDLKVIGNPTHNICDFYITNPEAVAHSSWFRSIQVFYNCGAKKLIFDENNNFTDTTLRSNVVLNQRIIEGSTRLPTNYGNFRLTINNCQIEGQKIWNANDKITFQNTDFKDIWFQNAGSLDFYNNILVRGSSVNTIRLDNFANVTAYVNAMGANGATVLDLAGRDISTLNVPTTVTELRNVIAGTINCSKRNTVDVTFRNVKANNVNLSVRYLTTYDSDISFSNEPTFVAFWGNDSKIYGGIWTTKSKQIICNGCYIGFSLNLVTDNTSNHGYVEFTNCTFQTNVSFTMKQIVMKNSITSNNTIKIYPHKDGDIYYLGGVTFENNILNNNNPIEFTKIEDDNVYDCRVNWAFIGNMFMGNDEGLRCRYWQNRTGSNYNATFIKGDDNNVVVYTGNSGKCPAENMQGISGVSGNMQYMQLSEDLTFYAETSLHRRCVTRMTATGVLRPMAIIGTGEFVNADGRPYRCDLGANKTIKTWSTYYCFVSRLEQVKNGDLFKMCPCPSEDNRLDTYNGGGTETGGVI
jgi:hypothetical protein